MPKVPWQNEFMADILNTRPVISYRVKAPELKPKLDVILAGSSVTNGQESTVVFIVSGDERKYDIEIAEAVVFQKPVAR